MNCNKQEKVQVFKMNAYKNKIRIQNAITYAIVIGCYILIQIMMAGGHVNSLLKGILVPLCTYTILAVSLNLTVGILGELSLGHAGFMCAGAFSGAFFNHAMKNLIASNQVRFILALFVGAAVAAVFGILIGIPVLRLKGDYLAIVTLAFGEIVKNIINVLYVGIDGNGIHVSMKDVAFLKAGSGRSGDHQGCTGYHRYTEDGDLYDRHYPGTPDPVYCIEYHQFPDRPCDHGDPR